MNKNALLWVALLSSIFIGLLWQYFPLQDASKRMERLPLYGPHFMGENIPLSSWEKSFFKDVNILKRIYSIKEHNLFISALDGTYNRHAVHDPLYCFRGGGWSVVEQKSIPLSSGGVVGFVKLRKADLEQEAIYWFSDGKHHYDRPIKYWWQATLRRLTLGRSGQEPILIVIQPIDKQKLDWPLILQIFPQLLLL